jgi:hypothetical protein
MLRAFIGTFVPVRLKLIEKSMLLRFTVTNGSKRVWNGDKLK